MIVVVEDNPFFLLQSYSGKCREELYGQPRPGQGGQGLQE